MSNVATETTFPATTVGANAGKMAELQRQMAAARKALAEATAQETANVLAIALKEERDTKELPTPVSNYLTAKMASAMFMTLRDELVSAYCKNEAIQEDKAIILKRKDEGSFRSDMEAAGAERTLNYYEQLEERLQEILGLISDINAVHKAACVAQHEEDVLRQQDIPEADRTYTPMPQLRWVSSADRAADPQNADHVNDLKRMTQQVEFWLTYNSK